MTEEEMLVLLEAPPKPLPERHPVGQLFAETTVELFRGNLFTLRTPIDPSELSHATECVSNLAKRVHNPTEVKSPERLAGEIVATFAYILGRYWDMPMSVQAARSGGFWEKAHELLKPAAVPVTTEQRH